MDFSASEVVAAQFISLIGESRHGNERVFRSGTMRFPIGFVAWPMPDALSRSWPWATARLAAFLGALAARVGAEGMFGDVGSRRATQATRSLNGVSKTSTKSSTGQENSNFAISCHAIYKEVT
jgi:hypothetical protein